MRFIIMAMLCRRYNLIVIKAKGVQSSLRMSAYSLAFDPSDLSESLFQRFHGLFFAAYKNFIIDNYNRSLKKSVFI